MSRETALRKPTFLIAVFGAIAVVIGASFLAYSLLPPRTTPPSPLSFSDVTFTNGSAAFSVASVSGGPYADSGFRIALTVNDFTNGSLPLGANNSASRETIGPNTYRIVWTDANGDGAVDVGDVFHISDQGGPLPALSYYEFDLRWGSQWTASARWTTP